jgi:hypothetical protein
MKLGHLLIVKLVLAPFFGLSCPLLPHPIFSLCGLSSDPGGIWTARLVGGSTLAFATLMSIDTRINSAGVRRAIPFALVVQDAISLIALFKVQLSGQSMPWEGRIRFYPFCHQRATRALYSSSWSGQRRTRKI